jgi:hypothetical protein
MKFNWLYLIVAIVAITAFAASSPAWGKWLFGLAILSALLLASNRIVNSVAPNVGGVTK